MGRGHVADYRLRPVDEGDVALLVAWHADPEVNRYWERRPLSADEIEEEYLSGQDPTLEPFIIESPPGTAAGFIQFAALDPPGEFGMDMFLIPAARGRGLGPRVARDLARRLHEERGAQRVTVDPLVANDAAVRAWARAGFVEESPIPSGDHGEPAILMVFRGTEAERPK